jgi:O-antigen/teichoic acid export membrane protein
MVHGLGLSAYGIYTIAFTIAGFGSYLDFGLGWTTARFVADADARGDKKQLAATIGAAVLYHAAVGLLFLAAILGSTGWIAKVGLHFQQPDELAIVKVLRIAGFSFVLSSLAGVFISSLRGSHLFARATVASVSGLTISVGGAALMARLGFGVVSAALAQLGGAAVGLLVAVCLCRKLFAPLNTRSSVFAQLRAMFEFSVWNYLNGLVQMTTSQLDKVLVGRFMGAAFLPFYTVPYGLAQRLNAVAAPAMTAIYPTATAGLYDREKFLKQYLASSRIVHMLTASGALAVLFWGPRFLSAWIGPEMSTNGSFFLRAFAIGFWILFVGSFDGSCIEGWNRPRITFCIVLFSLIAVLPLGFALSRLLDGGRSVAITVMGWQILTGLSQIVYWQRLSHYPIRRFLYGVCLPLGEMAMLAYLLAWSVGQAFVSRVAEMAVLPVMAGILAAYGFLRIFSRDERQQLISRLTFRALEFRNAAPPESLST